MRVYFAVSTKGTFMGGLNECIAWSKNQIKGKKARLIKIVRLRGGERIGRLVCELDMDGLHSIHNGRTIASSILKRNRIHG